MPDVRRLALTALHEIVKRGKKPKGALESLSVPLDKRDRAFLMELVYGVLRYRDTLDWVLRGFLKKPSGLSHTTIDNLRLAVYQILFMRVPEWAAVNEAVELEKKGGRPHLVNGVLRNVLRALDSVRARLSGLRDERDSRHIALATSHPEWLIKRWTGRFGEDKALELAQSNNMIPPFTIRVNSLKSERQAMLKRLSDVGIEGEPTIYSPDGITLRDLQSFRDMPFKDSLIVQDEASQLISYLLEPGSGERILDACAAPGGKTTHIAQIMKDRGEIVAAESEEKRIEQLKENISRLEITSARVIRADVRDLDTSEYCGHSPESCRFNRILLDAPCSSLGVIRRNPDVKYRHSPKDLLRFKAQQLDLLRAVSRFLGPGGILVYSVCSTEPEEGEEVIKDFLKDSPDFYIIDTAVPFLKRFMKDGFFRTYPHRDGMDGFFGARLCKKT